jgi:hypothetical protein
MCKHVCSGADTSRVRRVLPEKKEQRKEMTRRVWEWQGGREGGERK